MAMKIIAGHSSTPIICIIKYIHLYDIDILEICGTLSVKFL